MISVSYFADIIEYFGAETLFTYCGVLEVCFHKKTVVTNIGVFNSNKSSFLQYNYVTLPLFCILHTLQ